MKRKNLLSFAVALMLSIGCVPTAKETKCASNEAFDPNTRACVPSLASSTQSIYVSSRTPGNSYAMSLTGASVAHSVTVSDVYGSGYQVRWFVNFSNPPTTITNQLVAAGTSSYTFDPDGGSLFNAGAYTLEAQIYDAAGLVVLDTESWSITVHPDDAPTITGINPTSPTLTLDNATTNYNFSANALNPDDQVGTYQWYLDGVSQVGPLAIPTGGGTTPQAITGLTINPSGLANGTHSVTLTFYDGGGAVFDSFTWGILITDPSLPVVNSYSPAAPDIIDVIHGYTQAANGYLKSGAPLSFVFTVDDHTKHPDGLEVNFKVDGGSVYSQAFTANTITVSSGLPALNLANSQIAESHVIEATLRTTGSNLVVATYQWTIDLRPQNTSPVLKIDHATNDLNCNATTPITGSESTDVLGKGCDITQNVAANVVLKLTDEDYLNGVTTDYTHFGITWTLDGDNLDGTATLSTSNCNTIPNGGNTVAILTCSLTMSAFNTSGPLAPGTYTLTATARDDGSPYSVTAANSTPVSWTVEIKEAQTAPAIQTQETTLGSLPSLTNSYFELSSSGCTPSGNYLNNTLTAPVANELSYVLIHTVVQDGERDSFKITVDMENANPALPAGTYTNVAPTQTVTRVNDTLNYIHTTCVQVPEWVRWAGSDGAVNVRVSVTDIPSDVGTVAASNIATFSLYVVNNNPYPEFTATTAASPALAGTYTVMAGYPFTLNPGSYQDISTIDGDTISFQWQIDYGQTGAWVNIPGATSAILNWTPSFNVTDGTEVELRLCLGDDGGNAADCAGPVTAIKTWGDAAGGGPGFVVNNNITPALASSGEVANWFDKTDSKLYQVRLNSVSPTIVSVDQYSVDATTGAQTLANTITFTDENPTLATTSNLATDLSVTGIDQDSLFIYYKVIEGTNNSPQIRIRRVELDGGNFAFSYTANAIPNAGMAGDVTITGTGSPTRNIQFTGVPTAGDIISINGVDFTYGTDFCNPNCGSAILTASGLATALGASTNPVINDGITVSYTGGADNLDISKVTDWCDVSDRVINKLGDVKLSGGTSLRVPYTDVATNLQVSFFTLPGIPNPISCPTPTVGHTPLATGTFIQDIANDIDSSGNHYLALKNSAGNVDIHALDSSLNLNAAATGTQNTIFTMGSYVAINDLSLSVGSVASNHNVFVSALFEDAGGNETLGGAIFNATDYQDSSIISGFTLSHDLVQEVESAKITASETEAGSAYLSIVDKDAGPLYSAYMAKVTMADTTAGSYATDLTFENEDYPPLSTTTGSTISEIYMSDIYQNVTFGNDGAIAGEATRHVLFCTHHPANQAQTSLVNILKNTTQTTSTAITGSYPGFIP